MSKHGFLLAVLGILGGRLVASVSLAAEPPAADTPPCNWRQWEGDVAAFERQDARRPFAPGGVVFVGSSSIRMWDLATWFPELPALNRGFGGSQICDSVHFVDRLVAKHQPRLIVFYAGDNDINGGKSAERVAGDFRAFVVAVRKSLPDTPIVYISIKPSLARWEQRETQRAANKLIAAECEKGKSLEFVDVWPAMLGEDGAPRKDVFLEDGLHMNDAGYKLWVELLAPHLQKSSD